MQNGRSKRKRMKRKMDPLLIEIVNWVIGKNTRKEVKNRRIMLIDAMSGRDRRQKRKNWGGNTKNYRIRKSATDNLLNLRTPIAPLSSNGLEGNSSNKSVWKRKHVKTAKAFRNLAKVGQENQKLKVKADKYPKRYFRHKQ